MEETKKKVIEVEKNADEIINDSMTTSNRIKQTYTNIKSVILPLPSIFQSSLFRSQTQRIE